MDDLKLIKKHYGEKMSHLCRDLFPTILETPGLLFNILSNSFDYSKFLYDDIVSNNLINGFKKFIYSLVDFEEKRAKTKTDKTPFELMEEAGYTLYKCETEEDIQRFKEYFAPEEELCTFKGGRLKSCHVFFAVKKNAKDLKREDFKHPERQDKYGTSVISIQFSKSTNYLSIKNRYNHSVTNPDATFSNNLDNIIPGLSESFRTYYGYITQNNSNRFEIPNYTRTFEGKYYKYNYELDNVYYCANNVIIEHGKVKEEYLDKNRYLVFDYFILDLKEKKIVTSIEFVHFVDSFNEFINDLDIKRMSVVKTEDGNKSIIIEIDYGNKIVITIDGQNRIIGYYDDISYNIPNTFLWMLKYITEVVLKNTVIINDMFLYASENQHLDLESFIAPKLEEVGDRSLNSIGMIKRLYAPNLKVIGTNSLNNADILEYDLTSLEKVGNNSLSHFDNEKIYLPNLKEAGNYFLALARSTKVVDLPSIVSVGNSFLEESHKLKQLNAPYLYSIGKESLREATSLKELYLPRAKFIPDYCLQNATSLTDLKIPLATKIGYMVLNKNKRLKCLCAPNVERIGSYFLGNYKKLILIHLKEDVDIDYGFGGINYGYWESPIGLPYDVIKLYTHIVNSYNSIIEVSRNDYDKPITLARTK
jgi:hypothetical protein